MPCIDLNIAERIDMTFEEMESSWLAQIWGMFMFCVIFANVGLIVLQSMPDSCPASLIDEDHISHHIRCGKLIENSCVLIFSAEYFLKLACSPFTRIAVFDRNWLMTTVVPDRDDPIDHRLQYSRVEALRYFITRPMNLIDLIAILPFWVTLLLGDLIPIPLSFLRALRLTRFLRVMKAGRFNTTLLVLGETLGKSVSSVYVLMLYILMTSLIGGAVLQQAESDNPDQSHPVFETVPAASWWVLCRMLSMHHSAPNARGTPLTILGSTVIAFLMAFKAVIWILPFGQIGQTFRDTWAKAEKAKNIRKEVEEEDSRPPGSAWIDDFTTPYVTVEVFESEGGGDLKASGILPVPLLVNKDTKAEVSASLRGQAGELNPEMVFIVHWTPAPNENPSCPRGTLEISPELGRDFPSCRKPVISLRAPASLFGKDAETTWSSKPGQLGEVVLGGHVGEKGFVWEDNARFQIDWTSHRHSEPSQAATPASATSPVTPRNTREWLQEGSPMSKAAEQERQERQEKLMQLLEGQQRLLGEQAKRLGSIEQVLKEKKAAVTSSNNKKR
jgi:hypothetical protein